MNPITDANLHLFRAHRRAMESRLTEWIAKKLSVGHTLLSTSKRDDYVQAVDMSPVDGRCYASDHGGVAMVFGDPWEAARHYANRRMQNWNTLSFR